MAQQILLRRDTAAQWTAVNPTLAEGEIGVETDTVKLKVGTGTVAWNSLPYVSGGEGAGSHSLLLNLNADDHSQYHTDARGDARYLKSSDFPAQASEAELLAGTETALRSLSPADLVTAITEHGGSSTGTEPIYYVEAVNDVAINWANAPVQYIYVNPVGASIQIGLPADPGALSQAGILFVKNASGKAHTWNTNPAIRFVGETDADTVPTPAAVTFWTRYTVQWNDYASAWYVTLAGKDTA